MKTLTVKLTAILVLLAATMSLSAGNDNNLKASLNLKNSREVEIRLKGNSARIIDVKVFDNNGKLLTWKSVVNTGSKIVSHNIAEFPDGIYTYQVIEGNEMVYTAKVIKTAEGSLECRNLPEGTIASISQPNNDLVLVRLIKPLDARSKIIVSDDNGNILYRRLVKNTDNAKITHDISQFPTGNYYFSVYNRNELIAYRKVSK